MTEYARGIWESRYFWTHLVLSDLRSRWRRSFFGMLWAIIQPLALTLMLAVVFGHMFKLDVAEYVPYILSGVLVWGFVISTVTGGALAFVQSGPYIKQCWNPLAIYTLRTVLVSLAIVALASLSLIFWILILKPQNFGLPWLAVLSMYPLLVLIAWPMATFFAYVGVRFRDVQHALGLVLQALWFISPIYFRPEMFRNGGLYFLVDYNPVYHLLEIIRAPLLHGEWPTLENYTYCIGVAITMFLLAWAVGYRAEKKVIFYL